MFCLCLVRGFGGDGECDGATDSLAVGGVCVRDHTSHNHWSTCSRNSHDFCIPLGIHRAYQKMIQLLEG